MIRYLKRELGEEKRPMSHLSKQQIDELIEICLSRSEKAPTLKQTLFLLEFSDFDPLTSELPRLIELIFKTKLGLEDERILALQVIQSKYLKACQLRGVFLPGPIFEFLSDLVSTATEYELRNWALRIIQALTPVLSGKQKVILAKSIQSGLPTRLGTIFSSKKREYLVQADLLARLL